MSDDRVYITYDEGFEIIANLRRQIMLKGSIKTKDEKEKALLLDSLGLMESSLNDDQRHLRMQEQWNTWKKDDAEKKAKRQAKK